MHYSVVCFARHFVISSGQKTQRQKRQMNRLHQLARPKWNQVRERRGIEVSPAKATLHNARMGQVRMTKIRVLLGDRASGAYARWKIDSAGKHKQRQQQAWKVFIYGKPEACAS